MANVLEALAASAEPTTALGSVIKPTSLNFARMDSSCPSRLRDVVPSGTGTLCSYHVPITVTPVDYSLVNGPRNPHQQEHREMEVNPRILWRQKIVFSLPRSASCRYAPSSTGAVIDAANFNGQGDRIAWRNQQIRAKAAKFARHSVAHLRGPPSASPSQRPCPRPAPPPVRILRRALRANDWATILANIV